MKITVIGTGAIGGNLAARLSTAGHDVQVADARGPEAIRAWWTTPASTPTTPARWPTPGASSRTVPPTAPS
ncbi:ketopantoate reductase family protein [Streptomyces sp. CB00455]|uniref:ketopantoate reductase family protein n=1 Tax=Streptomyces sp. CB00455 TaxID=1703927 RepID=UPI001F5B715C|nr:NAD(P)-binding domain-containing protein [Streptomyces sp. CB00455]